MTASNAAQETRPPNVIVLGGAAIGGVKFAHKAHSKRTQCGTCHHAVTTVVSTGAPEACSDCHRATATAIVRTAYAAAFHDTEAKSGVCINCHKRERSSSAMDEMPTVGRSVSEAGPASGGGRVVALVGPVKCRDCHKKNVRSPR